MSDSQNQSSGDVQNLGVLESFEPIIGLADQNGSTIINFDSNSRYDLGREAKAEALDINLKEKGSSIAFKVDDVALIETDPNGMQYVGANVVMKLKQMVDGELKESSEVLHKLELALPALSRDDNGVFTHLDLLSIRMGLTDKIADAASFALENYFGCAKIQPPSAGQEQGAPQSRMARAAHLNVWNNDNNGSVPQGAGTAAAGVTVTGAAAKPTLWSLFKTWPLWKQGLAGVFALFFGWLVLVYASGFFRPVTMAGGAETLAQLQTSPEAHNAQVELTRETLKQMGLDPANVQSDLGCLAQ